MAAGYRSFTEFWPFYVCEHSKPATRVLHFIATLAIFPLLAATLVFSPWFALLVPVIAYGFAWFSHFFIENNQPATFSYFRWSLLGDFKMFYLMCRGEMEAELIRCRQIQENT